MITLISLAKIDSFLSQWAKSKAGKERINKYIIDVSIKGIPLADGTSLTGPKDLPKFASYFMAMLQRRMPASLSFEGGSRVGTANSIHSGRVRQVGPTEFEIEISFDPDTLHRDSLENDLGYDGVENIVALLNNGYHAKNYVYGWWNGHKPSTGEVSYRSGYGSDDALIRSMKEREPLYFVQDAAAEFEQKYGKKYGIKVEIGSDYKV